MGSSDSKLLNSSKQLMTCENPCFKQVTEKLYENLNETSDVEFHVGSEVIRAHRSVLAALSPKYEAQFYGKLSEKGPISVKDVSPAAFKEFLQFFYTEEVKLTIDNIEDVLNLSRQSLVYDLVTQCAEFLLHAVRLDKLCWCYRLAMSHEIKTLQAFCKDYISVHIKAIFQTTDFLNCDREVLHNILLLDTLNCKETEVFGACISWAKTVCKEKEVDIKKMSNLRSALGDVFFDIRFSSMTNEEFAAIHNLYSKLFTVSQSNEIFRVIGRAEEQRDFSNKLRTPKTTVMELVYFEHMLLKERSKNCKISLKTAVLVNFTSKDCEEIAFICDKKIQLNGFATYHKIADIIIDIEVGSRNLKEYAHTICETTVKFEKPIDVLRNERCFIKIRFEKIKSTNLRCFELKENVKEDDVWFQFSNTKPEKLGNRKVKLITELYFNRQENK